MAVLGCSFCGDLGSLYLMSLMRRGRDSNPGRGFPLNTLAVCCFQPLSHLSKFPVRVFSNNLPTQSPEIRTLPRKYREHRDWEPQSSHRSSVSPPNTLWQGGNTRIDPQAPPLAQRQEACYTCASSKFSLNGFLAESRLGGTF